MVGDADEAALAVVEVDAAGGVGHDEAGAAEKREDARGEDDLGHGVALIGVHAALHDGYLRAVDRPEDELAGVALHGGERPARDIGVGDGGGVLDLRGELAEAGAEDDAEGWPCGVELADGVGCG